MHRGNETEFSQQMIDGRWKTIVDVGRHGRGSERLTRAIDYVPMSRVLPAAEFGVLRTAFEGNGVVEEVLNVNSLGYLAYIMGRQYEQAETEVIRGLRLGRCRSGIEYSGFDMGSGESSLIALLQRLQVAPRGALVVIEELELGLHAEAQEKLVKVLIDLCDEKKLQIICTTHSETIIDSVPRRARILLRRNGDEHEAVGHVSTRFAVHEMAGQAQPELLVYTEDRLASLVVDECIAGPLRPRVKILDVGSNASLAGQSIAHLRMQPDIHALSVFDGDCTEQQVEGWFREYRAGRDLRPDWVALPGAGLSPERWILRELRDPAYRASLSQELNCSTQVAENHIQSMSVDLDNHDLGYTLSMRAGIPEEVALRMIVRAVARTHPALHPLKARILQLLDGP
jgi:hypothetical protein